jgi:enoyl-CoA hydratase/carnithine racemase
MVLACDLRIAVPTARFFYPVIKMGVLPQPSDPARLRDLIGPSAAKRILLTGAQITADEALALGLLDQISPVDLMSDVQMLTAPVRAADPAQVTAIKALIG